MKAVQETREAREKSHEKEFKENKENKEIGEIGERKPIWLNGIGFPFRVREREVFQPDWI